MHVKLIRATPNIAAQVQPPIIQVIFKNCVLFIKCISKINNTKVDDAMTLM